MEGETAVLEPFNCSNKRLAVPPAVHVIISHHTVSVFKTGFCVTIKEITQFVFLYIL